MDAEIDAATRHLQLLRAQRRQIAGEIAELRQEKATLVESVRRALGVYERLAREIREMNRQLTE